MKRAIYKQIINWYQAVDKPLPHWLENACQKDTKLAFERDQGESLTQALGKDPNEGMDFGKSNLTARVMLQITEENFEAEKKEGQSWSGVFRTATYLAAACFVLVAVFSFMNKAPVGNEAVDEEGVVSVNIEVITPDLSDIKSELLALQNPLDKEIENLRADAKGALKFLTTSFVPSKFIDKSRTSDDQA